MGLKNYIRLSRSHGIEGKKLIIWPETAVPYYIRQKTPLTEDLGAVRPSGALLLTGGLRSGYDDNSGAWNSVFVIDEHGKIVASYDKHHLVPFGEYIPFRGVAVVDRLIEAFAKDIGDFSRGPGPRTLSSLYTYPAFSPLICYEAIFPAEATDGTRRAQWLLSVVDDAWFGASSGPFQDAQMARMRAVEQGLPMLRAANTGISAIYDAYGRTISVLPLETEGVIDLYIPLPATHASLVGRCPESAILFMIALSMFFLCLRPKKPSASL